MKQNTEVERLRTRDGLLTAVENVVNTYGKTDGLPHDRVFVLGQRLEQAEARLAEAQERISDLECVSGLKAALEGCEHKARLAKMEDLAFAVRDGIALNALGSHFGEECQCSLHQLLAAIAAQSEEESR